MSLALSARGLEKRFGAVVALRGVDIDLESGRCLAVLGPNGAGKSTLLRLLAGLARPTRGELEIAGHHNKALRRGDARAHTGYVGHSTLLYPELSAHENLVFAARMHGVTDPEARASELLAAEDLRDVANRRAAAFSRGMSQRLSIARALVHDPDLVLLDEPFTGLDRSAADRLADRLLALRDQGRSCVLVTHELHQVSRLAHEAIVLQRGRVTESFEGSALDRENLERSYAQAVRDAESADTAR
ncbi:MAG: heme ABC exporter ATP-binding protein CcmA [Myxococcota bacterium]|nr:heme ABC exporter ATP-binding protein CcmA [Myxococcota bacterium]